MNGMGVMFWKGNEEVSGIGCQPFPLKHISMGFGNVGKVVRYDYIFIFPDGFCLAYCTIIMGNGREACD